MSNVPPRLVPRKFAEDDDTRDYFFEQMEALYELWKRLGGNIIFVKDAPAAANSSGVKGMVAFDDDYIYRCVDADTWKRVAISTWP